MIGLFGESMPAHPARYSKELRPLLREWIEGLTPVLDPMAGVGTLQVPGMIHGELELPWAKQCPKPSYQGDATHLPFADGIFGAVVCSPPYGNRMADNYAGDPKGSIRHTYRISLGQPLRDESAASLQWGPRYRKVMKLAWEEVRRVLRPGGVFVLNVKDHYRNDEPQNVDLWHLGLCHTLGFHLDQLVSLACPGQRHGANNELRTEFEKVYRLVKP